MCLSRRRNAVAPKGEDIGTANIDGSEVEGVTLVDLNAEQEQGQEQEQEQPLADENKGNHDESNGSKSLVEAGEPANTATSKEAVLPLGAAHPGAAAATAASPQQGAYPLEQPFPLQRRVRGADTAEADVCAALRFKGIGRQGAVIFLLID
jgi:hypothetical protein